MKSALIKSFTSSRKAKAAMFRAELMNTHTTATETSPRLHSLC